MKLNIQQKEIIVREKNEQLRQVYLQNYIDNHYRCNVIQSSMNQECYQSKLNNT
jgi:hypothetical protein